ncbi:hypothetical protein Q8F55_007071 [Vanrija albida]|uniref:Phosphoglycerate mutase n=1 Tax=Vanrija albida TaxID=181172 RepID=A0ABR3PZ30_9TREE
MGGGEKKRMPRVYLIRHGETEWSINGRHTGVSDIPLTANGEKVIKEAGPRIVGEGDDKLIHPKFLRHIFVSPRKRARRTFELMFGDDLPDQCAVETVPEVAEWDYGKYEGWLTKDIRKDHPGWEIWKDGCPPGETPGETPEQMTARVDGVIARIRKIHAEAKNTSPNPDSVENGDVIIFSHGHFTRAFIARWCNFPIAAGYHFSADPGGLAVLGYQHFNLNEPSLLGLNWYTEEQLKAR